MPPSTGLVAVTAQSLKDLADFYQAKDKDQQVLVHAGTDGAFTLSRFVTGAVKDVSEGDNTIVSLISTGRIDPVHDVMNPFGCDDRQLQKNKGVFFNHSWYGSNDLPIGKCLWTKPTREGLLAKTQYAVNENSFAADVFRLLQAGYLNSYSIGWSPKEWAYIPVKELSRFIEDKFDIPNISEFGPEDSVLVHNGWRCHEYSQVCVPMNMDAVRKMMGSGSIHSDLGKSYFGSLAGREKLPPLYLENEDEFRKTIAAVVQPCVVNAVGEKIALIENSVKTLGDSLTVVVGELKKILDWIEDPGVIETHIEVPDNTKTTDPPAAETVVVPAHPGVASPKSIDWDPTAAIERSANGAVSRALGRVTQ